MNQYTTVSIGSGKSNHLSSNPGDHKVTS
jgi:hypothetical protein